MEDHKLKFRLIYDEMFNLVFRYLRARTLNLEDAQDITSIIFTVIWEKIEDIDLSDKYQAWIFQITRNKLNDYLRKKYSIKVNTLSINEIEDLFFDTNYENNEMDNKDQDFKKTMYQNALDIIINQLSDSQRQFYKLKYVERLSNKEIAEHLNISQNYVKVSNNRLIKKIKEIWEKTQF